MALESIMNRQIEDPYLPKEPISNFAHHIVQHECYLLYDYLRVGLGYFIDDILKNKVVNRTINWVVENTKDSDRAVIFGTLGSMIANPVSVGIANETIKDPETLNDIGYYVETLTYTLIAAPAMYLQKREEGHSRVQSCWKTVKWGAFAAFLSYYYYKEGRGKVATDIHEFVGISYSLSNSASQIIGMFPFMWMLRGANGVLKSYDVKEEEWKRRFMNYLKDRKDTKP